MHTIVHISDLHFGMENLTIADALLEEIRQIDPAAVVISGDITQRARTKQYLAAKDFLGKIDYPQIIIPGNHDVPLFDVMRRTLAPLDRYKKYITDDLNPFFYNGEVAIYGINTARSLTWKAGRISFAQMEQIHKAFDPLDDSVFKVLVTHHPFIPSTGRFHEDIVGRGEHAIEVIAESGVDLLLAGHLHHGYSGDIKAYYPNADRSVISAQAGTAISRRFTRKGNGYNVITVDNYEINIEIRNFRKGMFSETTRMQYYKIQDQWERRDTIDTERLDAFLESSAA